MSIMTNGESSIRIITSYIEKLRSKFCRIPPIKKKKQNETEKKTFQNKGPSAVQCPVHLSIF